MVKRLNSKNFVNYNDHKKEVESKLFLYEERDPNTKEFEFEEQIYLLEDPENISLTGQITDPSNTISRSLFNSYEWTHLKASFAVGWLFVYLDFAPGSEADSKHLKFKVYSLKKKI